MQTFHNPGHGPEDAWKATESVVDEVSEEHTDEAADQSSTKNSNANEGDDEERAVIADADVNVRSLSFVSLLYVPELFMTVLI
jgi:hypothetical protein